MSVQSFFSEDSGLGKDFGKLTLNFNRSVFPPAPSQPFANHNFVIPAAANMLFDLDLCSH